MNKKTIYLTESNTDMFYGLFGDHASQVRKGHGELARNMRKILDVHETSMYVDTDGGYMLEYGFIVKVRPPKSHILALTVSLSHVSVMYTPDLMPMLLDMLISEYVKKVLEMANDE